MTDVIDYYKGKYPIKPFEGVQIEYEIIGEITEPKEVLKYSCNTLEGTLSSRTLNFKGLLSLSADRKYSPEIKFVRYRWDDKYGDYSAYKDDDYKGGFLKQENHDKGIPFNASYTLPEDNGLPLLMIQIWIPEIAFTPIRLKISDRFIKI